MELRELALILKNAIENGVDKALSSAALLPDQLTKSEVFRLYGRSNVERWILEDMIVPKACSSITFPRYMDITKLETIAYSCNRISYLPAAER